MSEQAEAETRRQPEPEAPRRPTALSWLRESAIILVSALALSWLVKTFLVQAFFIPSDSMNNTLLKGDRVLVTKLAPGPFDVHRGDIVVFKDPGGWLTTPKAPAPSAWHAFVNDGLTFVGLLPQDSGEHLIKRVIGVAGDTVVCCDVQGRITVNGVGLDEPYLKPGSLNTDMPFTTVVPADSLWVMGDNRLDSSDSRYNQGRPGGGSIPLDNVVGVAFVTVWPGDRMGLLRNPGSTFADVPDS